MLGRRVDLGSATDGLLLAVAPILLIVVIPGHAVDICIDWILAHPRAEFGGIDAYTIMKVGLISYTLGAGVAATLWVITRTDRWVPLRLTPARLVLTLLLTLLAIFFAALDMAYDR
jgi:hypothetical protein